MSKDNANNSFSKISTHKCLVEFNGVLDFNTMDSLINKVEEEMRAIENTVSIRKKVINIVIECIENIYKHSKLLTIENVENKYPVSFTLAANDEEYIVEIKNVIDSNSEKVIAKKLNYINFADKIALKEAYNKIILKGEISEKGGAGLGLIDIAIKSGNPVVYKFYPIDEIYSYFEMLVSIIRENKNK